MIHVVATQTTSLATVREALETRLHALTPTSLDSVKFRVHREEADFLAWSAGNPGACLRRFSLLQTGTAEGGEVANVIVREISVALELRIAYPNQWGRYGAQNRQDLDDVIEEDAERIRIDIATEGYGNYPSGSWPLPGSGDWDRVREPEVTYLTMSLPVAYYRSQT